VLVEVLRLRGFAYLGKPRVLNALWYPWFALRISCADSPSGALVILLPLE
jgi:hypothetical protein